MRFFLKVRRALATGGVRRLIFLAVHRAPRRGNPMRAESASEFDARYGIDTSGYIDQVDLDTHTYRNWVHGAGYQAASPNVLGKLVDALGIDPDLYTFVDLGSGKGRMVFAAIELGFRKAIGVEFSQTLMDCATANEAIFRRRCPENVDIEFRHCDAGTFELPSEPLVLYLYNPFQGPVMENVVQRALDRCKTSAEKLWIWYLNPQAAQYWDRSGFKRAVELPEIETVVWSR